MAHTFPRLQVTSSDLYVRLQTRNYSYHPATINGIQRMMLNYLKSYTFGMYLDPLDYDFLNEVLKVQRLDKMHQRFTTLSCNTKYPVPMLSLHVSRQAINMVFVDGEDILRQTDTRKIYFAICASKLEEPDPLKQIITPLKNTSSIPRFVYAQDMTCFVFTKSQEQDETSWTYNDEESSKVQENISRVFHYNGKMLLLEHGKQANILLRPTLTTGKEDPAGSPCRSSYRWTMNPVFKETFPIVNQDFTLRRKVEGEPSAKDMFLMVPTDEIDTYGKMTYQNKFGKPYGLDLMFQYNGKRDPKQAMSEAIELFKVNLNLFKDEMLSSDNKIVNKEAVENGLKLTIPLNIDIDILTYQSKKYSILIDDGILHAVSVKMLEILDKVIGEDISIWEHVSIYYKVPHRLISQSELFCSLPTGNEEFMDKLQDSLSNKTGGVFLSLINQAIDEIIINDLNPIQTELS